MKKLVILGFLALLAIDTAQQVTMKLAADTIGAFVWEGDWFRRVSRGPLVYGVLGFYVAAFVVYSWLLRVAPVGPAYAAVHGHVVTVLLISIVVFGERITLVQGIGCLLILAGIVVLAVTERLEE